MMRRSLWVTALALVLGVAACGGSTSTKQGSSVVVRTPERLVAATADATTHAKTARMVMAISVNSPELPRGVTIDMQGALAFDGTRADFTMNLGSMLPSAGSNAKVEVRMVNGTLYYDFAPFVASLKKSLGPVPPSLRGVKWLKLDATGLGSSSSGTPAQYTQYLDFLRAVSKGQVSTIGKDTVRGIATTHYRAQLSPKAIVAVDQKRIAKLKGPLRTVMQRGVDAIAKLHKSITADVWIDDHGAARRLQMAIPATTVSVGSRSVSESVSVRIDLFDFGTPVNVQAPPPADVKDMSQLTGALGGTSS